MTDTRPSLDDGMTARDEYFEARTKQPATPTHQRTGDAYNAIERLFTIEQGGKLNPDQARFAIRCVEDLDESEWRVRRDRDLLQAEVAALTSSLEEARAISEETVSYMMSLENEVAALRSRVQEAEQNMDPLLKGARKIGTLTYDRETKEVTFARAIVSPAPEESATLMYFDGAWKCPRCKAVSPWQDTVIHVAPCVRASASPQEPPSDTNSSKSSNSSSAPTDEGTKV